MNSLNSLWEGCTSIVKSLPECVGLIPRDDVSKVVVQEVHMITGSREGRMFVRLAGIAGATAVMMAAYGAHAFKKKPNVEPSQILAFDNANQMHLVHSVALLGVPLTRRPRLVGTLMCMGIILFSGSCYCHALSGNTRVRTVTPYGGMALILGWLAMVF
ncbi:transmembrane protein 256 homolog [Liolophura sinensis]|uniref:transmembrane protein 256 homolog n=1 Tax=Liolophura sinensis TaxID=3198878 RepID=UPI0031588E04